MPISASLSEILDLHKQRGQEDIHTALPAKVLSYDPASQTVTVQFCVRAPITVDDGSLDFEEYPTLSNVPVLFPRGGGYFITVPLTTGDFVWVMFAELPTGQWRVTGQVPSDSVETKRHGLGSAWAMPGAFPVADPLAGPSSSELRLGRESGVQMQIDATEMRLGSGTVTDLVALSSLVQTALNTIVSTFNLHTHGSPIPTTSTPTVVMGPLGPVAATEVKAK